ncbi:UNVERIFIED_CONTAM: hypothetical protein Slati_0454000 [Sesamum latifolium]|uniref:Reverse transcriptase domain-containing protein n=1 Tax=Sesamum latifolium TaxID=2727402 RepID=A0AAW2XW83_9LAMI
MDEVLTSLDCRVTPAMKESLLLLFTSKEIIHALKQMHPLKSPGPDGMSPVFYKKYWSIVVSDVCEFVLQFLNNGSFNPLVNHTHIVLIPKCPNPFEMSHFRPISLCNVLYKLVSKVFANRIKPFLNTLISPSQAVFVPGRLITDNVLVAYELHHFLKHKNRGKKGFVSLKLDVSKAYDRVEWRFLGSVLLRLGFHAKFISLIMTYVTTVSFSFLLNKVFSGMLRRAEEEGSIRGIAVSRLAPPISHLLFTDDTLIFCEASIGPMTCIKKVLSSFEQASGLQINLHKSTLVISSNVPEEQRLELANIIGVDVVARHDKYLSLPNVAGRSKQELFEDIKTRIWCKIHRWSMRKLSQAGRSVLIKAVLQTIPTYAMSCFRMPDQFLGVLESLMANFFWQGGNETKIHWVAWSKLCRTKAQGGLNFLRLREYNLALLAKQGWGVVLCPGNVLYHMLSHKYFPGSTFLDAQLGACLSYTWRSWASRDLLAAGIRWEVGNGRATPIMGHIWLPRPMAFQLIKHPATLSEDCRVAHLITSANEWNGPLILAEFCPEDAECILEIKLRGAEVSDEVIWHFEKKWNFSVKSAYRLELELKDEGNASMHTGKWNFIWHSRAAPKVVCFSPGDVLTTCCQRRSICYRETVSANVEQWFSRVHYDLERAEWDFFLTICWALWWGRNQRIFEGKRIEAHVVHQLACCMSGFTGGSVGFEGG